MIHLYHVTKFATLIMLMANLTEQRLHRRLPDLQCLLANTSSVIKLYLSRKYFYIQNYICI